MLSDISTVTYLVLAAAAAILVLLATGMIYIIMTQKRIMQRIESGDKKQTVENAAAVYNLPDEDLDSELVAVIAASVSCVLGRPVSNLSIKSIRRVGPDVPSWTLAGRQGQMGSRF